MTIVSPCQSIVGSMLVSSRSVQFSHGSWITLILAAWRRTAAAAAPTAAASPWSARGWRGSTSMSPQYSQRSWRHGPHGGVGLSVSATTAMRVKTRVPFGQRLDQRDALGAQRQPVGRVLDVAAGDDVAVARLERGADLEFRVAGLRARARERRGGDERFGEIGLAWRSSSRAARTARPPRRGGRVPTGARRGASIAAFAPRDRLASAVAARTVRADRRGARRGPPLDCRPRRLRRIVVRVAQRCPPAARRTRRARGAPPPSPRRGRAAAAGRRRPCW